MISFLRKYLWIFIIFLLGVYFQTKIPVNPDTSWLIVCAKRLLAQGNYLQDFFEVNPPASIYIYLPVALMAKYLPINILSITQLYIFLTGLLSFTLCAGFINRVFKHQHTLECWLKVTLAWLYWILPAFAFGEREHVAIILIMPYAFSVMAKINQLNFNFTKRIVVSLFAAIGFITKPFFLLCFIFSELFILTKTKKISCLFRLENWLVITITIFYILSIIFITPEYITNVLPFIMDLYYEVVGYSWSVMLHTSALYFYLLITICYWLIRRYQANKLFTDLLFCYSSIFLLIFLIQRTLWFYHAIPLASFLILLNVMLVFDFFHHQFSSLDKYKLIAIFKICITNFILSFTLLIAMIGSLQLNLYGLEKIYPDQQLKNKLVLANKINNHAIFYFSSDIWAANPVTNYLNLDSASRFCSLWMLAKLIHLTQAENAKTRQIATEKLNFVIEATIQDFNRWQPQLVFTVNKGKKLLSGNTTEVDYLALFSKNSAFKKLWKNYQYVGNFGDYSVYSRKYLL